MLQQYLPFTVLKQYQKRKILLLLLLVATVLTVYGIETFTSELSVINGFVLQQYLPFTVLKLAYCIHELVYDACCNSTYRLRY